MKKVACIMLLVGALIATPAAAAITVSFSPADQTVNIADGTATVDIVADIPEAEAVAGWGVDMGLAGSSVAVADWSLAVALGPDFDPVFAPDGDYLAGLSPDPVFGASVVLATVTVDLVALGDTDLLGGDDNPTDLNEGFQLDPTVGGGFASGVVYQPGIIHVVPEPGTLALLALGGVALLRRR